MSGTGGGQHGSPFRHLSGTVLVVDDDQDLLDGLSRAMRRSDFRILMASGPEEALAVLGRERVDVIVTDLQMPNMDGLELLDRARDMHPDAVRIVVTGHPTAESAISAINEEEVFRYLTKPVSRDVLTATLHMAFEKLAEERAAAAPQPARAPVHVRLALSPEEREALRQSWDTPSGEWPLPGLPPGRGSR